MVHLHLPLDCRKESKFKTLGKVIPLVTLGKVIPLVIGTRIASEAQRKAKAN